MGAEMRQINNSEVEHQNEIVGFKNRIQLDLIKRYFQNNNPETSKMNEWIEKYSKRFSDTYSNLIAHSNSQLDSNDPMYLSLLDIMEEELYNSNTKKTT